MTVLVHFVASQKELPAQESDDFFFDRITSENQILRKGLSQNTVYTVLQDRQGYIWFGTWDGLNKYDGYNFVIYNKSNGLSNETILTLLEDEFQRIWIGTEEGLNCLDTKTGNIRIYKHDPNDSTTLSNNWITYLYQDKPGRIMVCTRQGLNILDYSDGKVRRFSSPDHGGRRMRSNTINYITLTHDKKYLIGTNFGLIRYDPVTLENVRFLSRPGDESSLSSNNVKTIYVDRQNQVWIGTDNGLNLLDSESNRFRVFRHNPGDEHSLGSNVITDILEDRYGTFWVATDGGGLNIFDRQNNLFSRIGNNPKNSFSLSNNRVYDLFEDRNSTLWIGTFKGVNRLNRNSNKFKLFTHDPDDPGSIGDNFIWDFEETDKNIFWIATDNGISIFDRNKITFKRFNPVLSGKMKLSSNRIRNILKDKNGIFWIGTRDAGLNKYDPVTGNIKLFQPDLQDRNSICDNSITCLLQDRYGMLWVGTQNGLNLINPSTDYITSYFHQPEDSLSIPGNTIQGFVEDHAGNIWLATNGGLSRFNRNDNSFSTHRIITPDSRFPITNKSYCVIEDRDKKLWLGLRGGGLIGYDPISGTSVIFTMENGLPNNVVYGILEDDDNNLWLSTNWGISKFNKADHTFNNYDVTDGLQSNEFNTTAFMKSQAGEMYFGGMKGFNVFYPPDIKLNTSIPDIVITSFKIVNKAQPVTPVNGDTLVLRHDENFFTFDFSALDFTNPMKNKYAFILENYNKDWTIVDGTRHFAEYTKVDPGNYIFRVKGSNNDGIWNTKGISITVIIKPPWYSTWYFRIGVFVFLVVLIWLLVLMQIRRIRKKHLFENKMLQIEKQLFEMQQQALRLQMNPHFIFNSLNSIQSFVLSNDIDHAVNYLGRFSQLIRMILTNSRESIIPLADEIKAVRHYLEIEKLRFEDKFTYEIKVDPSIDEEFTGIPPMIVQPYVENAIIHGLLHKETKGHVNISFRPDGSYLICTIEDNGIGREKAADIKKLSGLQMKSRGMMITRERLDILNKESDQRMSVKVTDLTDQDNNPCGTRVELMVLTQEI